MRLSKMDIKIARTPTNEIEPHRAVDHLDILDSDGRCLIECKGDWSKKGRVLRTIRYCGQSSELLIRDGNLRHTRHHTKPFVGEQNKMGNSFTISRCTYLPGTIQSSTAVKSNIVSAQDPERNRCLERERECVLSSLT